MKLYMTLILVMMCLLSALAGCINPQAQGTWTAAINALPEGNVTKLYITSGNVEALCRLDGMGPQSEAAMLDFAARCERLGVAGVPIYSDRLDELAWMSDLIYTRTKLEVVLCPWWGGEDQTMLAALGSDAFHPGQQQTWNRRCPWARGQGVVDALHLLRRRVEACRPPAGNVNRLIVFMDSEWLHEPNKQPPGAVEACPRCKSVAGFIQGWDGLTREAEAAIDAGAGRPTPIRFFACLPPETLTPEQGADNIYVGYPSINGNRMLMPSLYHRVTDDPVVSLQRRLATLDLARQAVMVSAKANPVEGGGLAMDPAKFADMTKAIRKSGVAEMWVWPGLFLSLDNMDANAMDSRTEACLAVAHQALQ